MIFFYVVIVLVFYVVNGTIQPHFGNLMKVSTDFDEFAFDKSKDSNHLIHQQLIGTYNSTGRPYSAYAATFDPNYFSFYPPTKNGCTSLLKPSISSQTYDCEYATNGAFFLFSGASSLCVGNLISDSHIWQLPNDGTGNRANFGITNDNKYVTGFIDSNKIQSTNFTQLITGWGWLVRDGVNNVAESSDLTYEINGFTLEKAPRTSIGYYKNGTMILLVIDGEEDIKNGPDLFETAELLVSLGVESAINIDGGGSSVAILNGKIIDQPTCNDTPEICERSGKLLLSISFSEFD